MIQMRLADFPCGSVVKIGDLSFVVLEQCGEETAVITKDFVRSMPFGNGGDWRTSDIRAFCNGDFYQEISKAVGKENIYDHMVNLSADDGTGKDEFCRDYVSLLTTEEYRRYREFLPAYGKWWWLATRVSYDVKDYGRYVCNVGSCGILNWDGCDYSVGVRPFCILNSSILVSSGE